MNCFGFRTHISKDTQNHSHGSGLTQIYYTHIFYGYFREEALIVARGITRSTENWWYDHRKAEQTKSMCIFFETHCITMGHVIRRSLIVVMVVTHVPWCMPGSLTRSFLWIRRRGTRSRHSRRMRNLQFWISGKRPMGCRSSMLAAEVVSL